MTDGQRVRRAGVPVPGREERAVAAVRGWVLPGREPPGEEADEGAPPLAASAKVRTSVVVAVRDRAEDVAACVPAVLDRLGPEDELVVVDDASLDATWRALGEVRDERLRRVRVAVRRGAAWAANLGLQHAWGRVLVVPDDLTDAAELVDRLDELLGGEVLAVLHEGRSDHDGRARPAGVLAWRNAALGRVGHLDDTVAEPFVDWRDRLRRALVPGAVGGDGPGGVESEGDGAMEVAPVADAGRDPGVLPFPARQDPVTATMASVPERRDHLARVVRTLLPQVDRLCVHLNGYDDVPDFLEHPRVVVSRSQDRGDLRDNGKFAFGDLVPRGYHVVLDDDIDYAQDHVDVVVARIEQYGRRAIVGYHGVVLDTPVTAYFDARTVFHFGTTLREDQPVHLLGSGTVALHTDTLRFGLDDLPTMGMADVWLAVAAQRAGIPLVAVSRPSRHLRQRRGIGPTLFEEFRRDDAPHVAALRGVDLRRRTVVPTGPEATEVREW